MWGDFGWFWGIHHFLDKPTSEYAFICLNSSPTHKHTNGIQLKWTLKDPHDFFKHNFTISWQCLWDLVDLVDGLTAHKCFVLWICFIIQIQVMTIKTYRYLKQKERNIPKKTREKQVAHIPKHPLPIGKKGENQWAFTTFRWVSEWENGGFPRAA